MSISFYVGYSGRVAAQDRNARCWRWAVSDKNPVIRWENGSHLIKAEMKHRFGFDVVWFFDLDMPFGLYARLVESYIHLDTFNLPCFIC